ncbi:hypothetical protein [Celeribacter sp.]|uniref:hypothetical protein n=1 Tax=Celeribacter sp. TaxID=1890673 RepID=UPI003A918A79
MVNEKYRIKCGERRGDAEWIVMELRRKGGEFAKDARVFLVNALNSKSDSVLFDGAERESPSLTRVIARTDSGPSSC